MIRRGVVPGTGPGKTVETKRNSASQGFLRAFASLRQQSAALLFPAGFLGAVVLAVSGCVTLHVPAVGPDFTAREYVEKESKGIVLRVRPIVGKESYGELFDDDLPQVGIVAVWATVENHSRLDAAVDPGQWYLQVADHRCRSVSANKMVDRYYHERGIRLYVVQADERTRERLEKLSMRREALAPGASAEGFVFFRIDHSAPPSWNLDATLIAEGIRLGGARKLDMQLPLYAHP